MKCAYSSMNKQYMKAVKEKKNYKKVLIENKYNRVKPN